MCPIWQGKPLIVSNAAYKELLDYGMNTYDIITVLENGYDCPRSKRKSGTIERCLKRKDKITKVVVVESLQQWSEEMVWLIIHVGRFK